MVDHVLGLCQTQLQTHQTAQPVLFYFLRDESRGRLPTLRSIKLLNHHIEGVCVCVFPGTIWQ